MISPPMMVPNGKLSSRMAASTIAVMRPHSRRCQRPQPAAKLATASSMKTPAPSRKTMALMAVAVAPSCEFDGAHGDDERQQQEQADEEQVRQPAEKIVDCDQGNGFRALLHVIPQC